MEYNKSAKCRHCKESLIFEMINLGKSPASNSYLNITELDHSEKFYPLTVYVCKNCFLAQVPEYKSHQEIFNNEYAYFSSYSNSWLEHVFRYVEDITLELGLTQESFVTEIASNDGYLLKNFIDKKIPCLGIEPTQNTALEAQKKGIETITEFFSLEHSKKLQKSDLIICNNVLAHVPDINDFIKGLKNLLLPKATITIEFPHLLSLIKYFQFDTIYHEHYSYLSLYSTKRIFEKFGLTIYKVVSLSTHGGSLRVFVCHVENKNPIDKSVNDILNLELKFGLNNLKTFEKFKIDVFNLKHQALNFLFQEKKKNKKIIAYGAAAKGNTFLNYCGIGSEFIDFVVDRSKFKQGKYLPGNNIPIVSEEKLIDHKPDYIIILPWNLTEEIIQQLSYAKKWGCLFVTFIPKLKINK